MKYTKEQHEFMREFIPGHHHEEIIEEFFVKFDIILTKRQVGNYIKNNRVYTGFTGRYEKGHVPQNKGKKMSLEQYEKCKNTMFKQGQSPHNTEPVGTEKMFSDGYIWVKINNRRNVRTSVNWKQKHRLIWEQHYGPIPEGGMITFLDGDHRNFDLDNLALVDKPINAVMNGYGLRTADTELSRVGMNIAKLKLKIGEKDGK